MGKIHRKEHAFIKNEEDFKYKGVMYIGEKKVFLWCRSVDAGLVESSGNRSRLFMDMAEVVFPHHVNKVEVSSQYVSCCGAYVKLCLNRSTYDTFYYPEKDFDYIHKVKGKIIEVKTELGGYVQEKPSEILHITCLIYHIAIEINSWEVKDYVKGDYRNPLSEY